MTTNLEVPMATKAARKGSKATLGDGVFCATYPDGPPRRKSLLAERIVDFAINSGRTVAVDGPHGIGKSSFFREAFLAKGVQPIVFSLPTIEIPDLYMPLPKKEYDEVREEVRLVLEMHLAEKLVHPDQPWAFIGDDWRRVQPQVMSALMELTNEKTLTGLPLDNMVACLLVDNPVGDGYQGVIAGDFAIETRMPHFRLTANDIPWREALAVQFADADLTDVFDVWSKLTPELRRTLCPRVLEHVIDVTLAGLPPIVGLPIMPSGRQRLMDADQDRTDEILSNIAGALGVPFRAAIPNLVETAMRIALERGWNLHGVGTCGVAKTATVKSLHELPGNEDLDTVVFSAANMQPGDLAGPAPVNGKIQWILNPRVMATEGRRKHIVFDEMFRAPKVVKPQMLEIFQERSVCGEETGAHAVWALNNPAKAGALTFRVGNADEALCSRFTVNIEITAADTKWREYLVAKHGEDLTKPFLEWRDHVLDDTGRDYISPRVLEIMMELHRDGLDVENALPFLNGKERLPVVLSDLRALLAKKRVLGFTKIVAEHEQILDEIRNGDEISRAEREMEVVRALQKADPTELEPHFDLCVELLTVLPKDKRLTLINVDASVQPARQDFWKRAFLALKRRP
jgi:MoxR-like ATPase